MCHIRAAGHLDVDPASVRPLALMDDEEAAHLGQDPVEGAGLVAGRGFVRVAVHRIAGPDDRQPLPLGGEGIVGKGFDDQEALLHTGAPEAGGNGQCQGRRGRPHPRD